MSIRNCFFPVLFLWRDRFFGGHIFGSNQDIELFFFTDRPSGILVRVRGFIVFHQPLYFLFPREKLHIPFTELEDEYNDTLPCLKRAQQFHRHIYKPSSYSSKTKVNSASLVGKIHPLED
jgi:hypothetical protein